MCDVLLVLCFVCVYVWHTPTYQNSRLASARLLDRVNLQNQLESLQLYQVLSSMQVLNLALCQHTAGTIVLLLHKWENLGSVHFIIITAKFHELKHSVEANLHQNLDVAINKLLAQFDAGLFFGFDVFDVVVDLAHLLLGRLHSSQPRPPCVVFGLEQLLVDLIAVKFHRRQIGLDTPGIALFFC